MNVSRFKYIVEIIIAGLTEGDLAGKFTNREQADERVKAVVYCDHPGAPVWVEEVQALGGSVVGLSANLNPEFNCTYRTAAGMQMEGAGEMTSAVTRATNRLDPNGHNGYQGRICGRFAHALSSEHAYLAGMEAGGRMVREQLHIEVDSCIEGLLEHGEAWPDSIWASFYHRHPAVMYELSDDVQEYIDSVGAGEYKVDDLPVLGFHQAIRSRTYEALSNLDSDKIREVAESALYQVQQLEEYNKLRHDLESGEEVGVSFELSYSSADDEWHLNVEINGDSATLTNERAFPTEFTKAARRWVKDKIREAMDNF